MDKIGKLILENGTKIEGLSFGCPASVAGEVVFNTGMVGYPETLTDPSYCGQILVLTYPLIGNYGVPPRQRVDGILKYFESEKIQVAGLIVANYSSAWSHYLGHSSLGEWLKKEKIPALTGIDTRQLTQWLRQHGTVLGKIIIKKDVPWYDPNKNNILGQVSFKNPKIYGPGRPRIALVDCGMKNNILRELIKRKVTVIRVPWDFNLASRRFYYDGVIISNGPGNPAKALATIDQVKWLIEKGIPTFGICLGNQLLALALGAKTYKLKFGHRSQNQPCQDVITKKCYITSQNHGFAVKSNTLSRDCQPWFINLNDQTIEGIRHRTKPLMSVQFHPEAFPGPSDTAFLFDEFLSMVKKYARKR